MVETFVRLSESNFHFPILGFVSYNACCFREGGVKFLNFERGAQQVSVHCLVLLLVTVQLSTRLDRLEEYD